jgi:hypothetical protein
MIRSTLTRVFAREHAVPVRVFLPVVSAVLMFGIFTAIVIALSRTFGSRPTLEPLAQEVDPEVEIPVV